MELGSNAFSLVVFCFGNVFFRIDETPLSWLDEKNWDPPLVKHLKWLWNTISKKIKTTSICKSSFFQLVYYYIKTFSQNVQKSVQIYSLWIWMTPIRPNFQEFEAKYRPENLFLSQLWALSNNSFFRIFIPPKVNESWGFLNDKMVSKTIDRFL